MSKKKLPTRYFIIILYVVVLPIIAIIGIYLVTFLTHQPKPFGDENVVITNVDDISDFDYKFILLSYRKQTTREDGTEITSRFQFNEEFTNIKQDMYNINVSYGLYDYWTDFEKTSLSNSYNDNFYKTSFDPYTRAGRKSITFTLNNGPLPFVSIDNPTLFIKIEYSTESFGVMTDKIVYLKYDYADYMNDDVTIE